MKWVMLVLGLLAAPVHAQSEGWPRANESVWPEFLIRIHVDSGMWGFTADQLNNDVIVQNDTAGGTDAHPSMLLDTTSIQRIGPSQIAVWTLSATPHSQVVVKGLRETILKEQIILDCDAATWKGYYAIAFHKQEPLLTAFENDVATPIPPETVQAIVLQCGCFVARRRGLVQ